MKKITTKTKGTLMLGAVLCLSALAGCDPSGGAKHNFADVWSTDENQHWHACTDEGCEEKKDEAEHVWGEGEITRAATCTTDGVRTYTCVCGKTKTETIEATGHNFAENPLLCKNCGAFKALYEGQYYDITDSDRVPFVCNPDYSSVSGRIYTTNTEEKAKIATSAIANPLTFVVHATGGSDKSSVAFAEDGNSYSLTLTESDKVFQNFTRFSYKSDFKGTLLVSFEMSVDKEVKSVTGAGLYVQDATLTNFENRSGLVGSNGAITMVPGKTYRFVYRVELKDHANETLAIAANKFSPVSGVLPTLTVSNLRMKEISTNEPEAASVYLLSFTEDAPLALADCTHLTKQAVAGTATCSTEGILAHDHCLTCGKDLIENTEVSNLTGKLPHEAGLNPEWQKDETGHWHNCKECSEKIDFAEHTPDPNATPGVDDVYCLVCGYKISEGTAPHVHSFQKVDAVPTCTSTGGHVEYYKCNCGQCASDVEGNTLIEEPAAVIDILNSTHDYDDSGVCKVCGASKYSINVHTVAEGETVVGTQPQTIKGTGNASFAINNPGLFSIQSNVNGFEINDEDNNILASAATNATKEKNSCFVRITPSKNLATNGGTVLMSFDMVPQDNQADVFEFGIGSQGTDGKNKGTSITTAAVPEATIGKTYHVVVLVTMEIQNYINLAFKNVANGNVKVRLSNFQFVEYKSTSVPAEATGTGVVKVSWPWAN